MTLGRNISFADNILTTENLDKSQTSLILRQPLLPEEICVIKKILT